MANESQYSPSSKMFAPWNKVRKMAAWIALASIVIFSQIYFTEFWKTLYVKDIVQALHASKNRVHSKPEHLHILIVAYARTGSSFLGDLIQSLPNSFYHYEPIHFLGDDLPDESFEEARDLLGNLFVCNISQIEGFLSWQKSHPGFMKLQRNTRYWKKCSENNSCYSGSYINEYCHNQTIVIAKTIRINLLEASKLFTTHPHLNLKIIYLARDPRGTMNSRMDEGINSWCKDECANTTSFCITLSDDLSVVCNLLAKRPGDFTVVRYEDVSTKPYEIASQLVKFLGLQSMPPEMYEFLVTHSYFNGNVKSVMKDTGLGYAYITFRNSSKTAVRWKSKMTFENVNILQRTCKRFLSAYGYHFYKNLTTLRASIAIDDLIDFQTAIENTCNISYS